MDATYSLAELSEHAGLEPRVIRSYIQQGLLGGPATRGRYARYSDRHLERLLAIRALREGQGLPLGQVRQKLLLAREDEIRALAAAGTPDAGTHSPPVTGSSSALAYLRSIARSLPAAVAVPAADVARTGASAPGGPAPAPPAQAPTPAPTPTASTTPNTLPATGGPLEALLVELSHLVGNISVPRQARGEPWFRIAVTPDLEIAIRGAHSADDLARLERIADHLRALLLGGIPHDRHA